MNTATTQTSPSILDTSRIVLAHGGGGQLTDQLISQVILPRLGNPTLNELDDAAILNDQIALTIDSYVVDPWQFPGGDIGRLAVCGTVNDLAVSGAKPLGIALSLILTEGFAKRDLQTILDSIGLAAKQANVQIVTGDTKVIPGNGIFITTAGVGLRDPQCKISSMHIKPGDKIIINRPIAEHGLTVMLAREMPDMMSVLKTDASPLNGLIENLLNKVQGVHFLRDATRSGIAGVTTDIATNTGYHVMLNEPDIPVDPHVQHAADMLGLDVLEVANEGVVVAVVDPAHTDHAVKIMRQHTYGKQSCIIGEIQNIRDGICEITTVIGGRRVVHKPYGEQLPRIC
ncbi:MAG: hydrogenase expression/formation protein HypE [Phycisphaeraceae bacterium]|nr:hydrogenase expression/formation protein HypE [Phycisphaeraceae bacterium]